MKLTYEPNDARYCFLPHPQDPCDVEKNNILSKAISLKYDLEIVKNCQDVIDIKITEANHHHALVQFFSEEQVTCSCDQYYKIGASFCKHIALLQYLRKNARYQEEMNFISHLNHSIKKIGNRQNSYRLYDSRNDLVISLSGNNYEIITPSYLVMLKHLAKYRPNPFEVNLPNPYVLTNEITLYPYQQPILENMLYARFAICSMIMGSGKTLTAIAGLKYLQSLTQDPLNVLIVCPKSIMDQWSKEIDRILELQTAYITGINSYRFIKIKQIGICTYQTMSRNIDVLKQKKYDVVIADEIQYIRNDTSQAWDSLRQLNTKFFWGLSGTIIENRLDDLYNILEAIAPGLCGAKWKFEYRFKKLKSIHKRKVLYHNEIIHKKELHQLISKNVFSYDDLELVPMKKPIKYFAALDALSQEKHDNYIDQANRLISKSLNTPLTFAEQTYIQMLLLRARQCCNSLDLIQNDNELKIHTESNGKIEKILEIISDVCIKQNQKLVLYSEWTEMLSILENHFQKMNIEFVRFDGSLSTKKRGLALETFKNKDSCKLFCSSDAGGIGIDGLQLCCSNVLHVELPWNPAKIDQRNGRLHRLLQTKSVQSYHVIMQNSIEEKINDLLEQKRKVRFDTLFNDTLCVKQKDAG